MCFALAAILCSYGEFNHTDALLSFVITFPFLLGTSPRAISYHCGTTSQQHHSKTLPFPGFGGRIIYLFFLDYLRSHRLLLVQTFSIRSVLHGDRFPSLGFDCLNQLYGLLIFNSSLNFACFSVFPNPCSSE